MDLYTVGVGDGGGGGLISGWAYKPNKKMFRNDDIERI